jgi:aspartate aminotransferase
LGPSSDQEGASFLYLNHTLNSIAEPPQATEILLNDPNLDHEYLPITGLPEFTSGAAKLILGADSPAIAEGRAVSVQTISGTGANHLGALFLSKFYHWDAPKQIYLSNPTWGEFL